jgi:hypothetical protein
MTARINAATIQSRKSSDAQLNVGLLRHARGDLIKKAFPGAESRTLAPSPSKWTGFLCLLNQIPSFQLEDSHFGSFKLTVVDSKTCTFDHFGLQTLSLPTVPSSVGKISSSSLEEMSLVRAEVHDSTDIFEKAKHFVGATSGFSNSYQAHFCDSPKFSSNL